MRIGMHVSEIALGISQETEFCIQSGWPVVGMTFRSCSSLVIPPGAELFAYGASMIGMTIRGQARIIYRVVFANPDDASHMATRTLVAGHPPCTLVHDDGISTLKLLRQIWDLSG